MALFLEQREPGPAAILAGIEAWRAGEEARHGGIWQVASLPDRLKGSVAELPAGDLAAADAAQLRQQPPSGEAP